MDIRSISPSCASGRFGWAALSVTLAFLLMAMLAVACMGGCAAQSTSRADVGTAGTLSGVDKDTGGVEKNEAATPVVGGGRPLTPAEIHRRLRSANSATRRQAIGELLKNCDRASHAKILVELLTGQDMPVIDEVLDVLAVERPQTALPLFLSLLPARPQLAAKVRPVMFAAYGPEPIAAAIISTLRKSDRQPLTAWSFYLSLLVQCRSARAVEYLIEELSRAERDVKPEIVRALELLTGQSLDEADWSKWWQANRERSRESWLEDALAEARRTAMSWAAELLSLRLQAMKTAGATTEQTDDFLRQILMGKSKELRRAALVTMLETDRDSVVRLAEDIARLASAEYGEETRVLALRLLAGIGEARFAAQIAGYMTDHRPTIRKAAAAALGKISAPTATAALLGSLNEEDPAVLASVIESLGALKVREAVPKLVEFIDSRDSLEVLHATLEALGAIAEPTSAGVIIAARKKFMADRRLRRSFAAALGSFNAPGVEDALKPLLADECSNVRLAAVDSLGRLKAVQALPELAAILGKDEEPSVRRAAATAIGQIGERSAIPQLLQALENDELVTLEAWQAVQTLANDDPELLLSIAERLAGASVTEHRIKRLAVDLLRGLLDPARSPAAQPDFLNRCREFLARILVESGEDMEAVEVLELLHASGGRSEWSETALLGAYRRTFQFTKAVALCDEMLAREELGSERALELRLERVALLFGAGEFELSKEAANALLAEAGVPETLRARAGEFIAKCDEELERIATAEQLVRQQVSAALAEMLSPDAERRDLAALQVIELGRKAVPVLLEILDNGQTEHYQAISRLLGSITGLEYHLTSTSSEAEVQQAARAWRNWWDESQ